MQPTRQQKRRNGTLQSCEPCRKAKLRCDHGVPICGRCLAKNIRERCYYHPSPMTKRRGQNETSPLEDSPSRITTGSTIPNQAPTRKDNCIVADTPVQEPWISSGYLGSTSYFAIFREHQDDIPIYLNKDLENTRIMATQSLNIDRIWTGARALRIIYDFPVIDPLIRRSQARTLVAKVPDRIIDSILSSIREVFGSFDATNIGSQLQDLSIQVFQNSSQLLATHKSMSVEQYCSSFTGKHFRWEALGNVFAISAMALMGTPDNDPILMEAKIQAKDELLTRLIEASELCVLFCDQATSANELLGFLQCNDLHVKTQQYGDSSYQAWRRLGDVAATVYAAGLHELSSTDDYPFFLCEWRRLCFAVAYTVDKSLAMFLGRPPLISSQYCELGPPQDLSEDILLAGDESCYQALVKLDNLGWGRQSVNRVSILRLRFLLAITEEEALAIYLSASRRRIFDTDTADFRKRSQQTIQKARETWNSCPDHLRYERYIKTNPFGPHNVSFYLLLVYLQYLHSCFILERGIVRHTGTGHEDLYDTSRRLLSTVITLGADRDPLVDRSRHYSWLMLYYGLPSASVLALELSRQTQRSESQHAALPRTEVIRNLTVFASCLSWVARPTHGNYLMCKDAERKLSHIINSILDPGSRSTGLSDSTTTFSMNNFPEWYEFTNWDVPSVIFSDRDGFSV